MKNLLIIGARGFGREVYNTALESIGYGEEYTVKGFLDDKSDALDGYEDYPPIIGPVENYIIEKNDVFICALGDVHYKKKYADIILSKGGEFINLIHNKAFISKNVKIGKGCIFCIHSSVSCDVTMGDFVTFQSFSVAGHDVTIGNYVQINAHSFMGGFVQLGDMTTLHTGAIVHPHVRIETGAIVGAGSVAIRKVKADTTVFGIPARKLEL